MVHVNTYDHLRFSSFFFFFVLIKFKNELTKIVEMQQVIHNLTISQERLKMILH